MNYLRSLIAGLKNDNKSESPTLKKLKNSYTNKLITNNCVP